MKAKALEIKTLRTSRPAHGTTPAGGRLYVQLCCGSLLWLAVTIAFVETGTTGRFDDRVTSGSGAPYFRGVPLSSETALFLEGRSPVTVDVKVPDHPWEVARRTLHTGAEAFVVPGDPPIASALHLHDGFVFVAARTQGIHVYDVTNPCRPVFVGFLPSFDSARPATVQVKADRVIVSGCPPLVFGPSGRRRQPKIMASPPVFRYQDRASASSWWRRPRKVTMAPTGDEASQEPASGGKGAASAGDPNPLSERSRPKISSEDSWYVTTCLLMPGASDLTDRASGAAGQDKSMEKSSVKEKRRRAVAILRLKAAVTPPRRAPIEVAHVAKAAGAYRYSALDLMVNRRASVERYW